MSDYSLGSMTNVKAVSIARSPSLRRLATPRSLCRESPFVSLPLTNSWAMVSAVTSGGAVGGVLLIIFALCMG